eukprot:TRINITY_DN2097_c0_g1_i2.p1 TRINITY_DN2097_c0_g1~~TRINITY_DN2097_c0_g1_i2.p1  ORF type:complete len:362 (-),score=36.66 TRINITY_DN2097_c0_g1_i2:45-1130(-)
MQNNENKIDNKVNPLLKRESLIIISLIFGWYVSSSVSNNLNKQILNNFSFPMTLAIVQLFQISLYSFLFLWMRNQFAFIGFSDIMKKVLPLGLFNFASHAFTYMSLANVPVSFMHTIKATSPIFTVILSFLILDERYGSLVIVSLLPIIFGVSLCTFTEVNINQYGLIMAIVSTILFVLQNIYSKSLFRKYKFNPVVLSMYTALCAFLCNIPLWLLTDGQSVLDFIYNQENQPIYLDNTVIGDNVINLDSVVVEDPGPSLSFLLTLFLLNGFAHWAQYITAFNTLNRVTPVTYAVSNTLKRVFVIVTSILYFHNTITFMNAFGILISISGVYFYTRAKQYYNQLNQRTKNEIDITSNVNRV